MLPEFPLSVCISSHELSAINKPETPYENPRSSTKIACCLALAATGMNAIAGEGYKLRQSPIGAFGGEMAAPVDNPGLFGTASLTHLNISKAVDGNGNNITLPAQTVPLVGAYRLNVAPGTIDFHQTQTQLSLVGGYLTESLYADGRLAFAVNVPVITMSRTFIGVQPLGTVSPTPVPPAIATAAIGANYTVQARVAASSATQNASVTGFGDTELSAVWIRHQDRLKVAAGVSLFVPTGAYDKNRGPNPGSGNFYTVRPGVAVTYALNPNSSDTTWDAGFNLQYSQNFGGRNALVAKSLQLRFVKAW